ncbi:antioxidant AhpC [marine bacterium AO1-C]|nr:antioxidant AhpC [marine bacterium AO1-C]
MFKTLTKNILALALVALFATAFRMGEPVPQKAEDVSPLLIGESIPEASLMGMNGQEVNLKKFVESKPTVVIFYRGGWCPFCNRQLAGLQKIEKDILKMGYQILAVSPDSPENLKKTMDKNTLSYTLVSDASMTVAKKFGIAFQAPERYRKFLTKSSGGKNTENLLPVPAVFLLDTAGKIKFEYINPNYRERLSPELLMAAAKIGKASK